MDTNKDGHLESTMTQTQTDRLTKSSRFGSASSFGSSAYQEAPVDQADTGDDLRGCCIYLVFLFFFIASVLAGSTATAAPFWTGSAVEGEVVTFNRIVGNEIMTWGDLGEMKRFWDYMIEVVLDEMIVEDDYDDNPLIDERDMFKFGKHLDLLGGIRLRQYRVKSEPCTYRGELFKCYTEEESKEIMKMPTFGEDIEWTSRSENKETPYYTGAHRKYPGSGFVVILPRDGAKAVQMVEDLKQDLWIDGHTRMISIDWNLFNPTTGLHTVARVVFEFGRSAAVIPSRSIRTWRFMRYENNVAAIVFDVIFVLLVVATMVSEFVEWFRSCKAKEKYWSFWNMVDWFCLVLIFIIYIFVGVIYSEGKKLDLVNSDKFESLVFLEYLMVTQSMFIMICGMLLFIKFFKYVNFSSRMTFVFTMLRRSGLDILIFMCLLWIFVSSFGFAGYILFQNDTIEYRCLWFAVANIFRAIVDDLHYDTLVGETQVENWIFVSAFYVLWGVFVIMVLSNVFIAILSESYANVQIDFDRDIKLKTICKTAWNMVMLNTFHKNKKKEGSNESRSSTQSGLSSSGLPSVGDEQGELVVRKSTPLLVPHQGLKKEKSNETAKNLSRSILSDDDWTESIAQGDD